MQLSINRKCNRVRCPLLSPECDRYINMYQLTSQKCLDVWKSEGWIGKHQRWDWKDWLWESFSPDNSYWLIIQEELGHRALWDLWLHLLIGMGFYFNQLFLTLRKVHMCWLVKETVVGVQISRRDWLYWGPPPTRPDKTPEQQQQEEEEELHRRKSALTAIHWPKGIWRSLENMIR